MNWFQRCMHKLFGWQYFVQWEGGWLIAVYRARKLGGLYYFYCRGDKTENGGKGRWGRCLLLRGRMAPDMVALTMAIDEQMRDGMYRSRQRVTWAPLTPTLAATMLMVPEPEAGDDGSTIGSVQLTSPQQIHVGPPGSIAPPLKYASGQSWGGVKTP